MLVILSHYFKYKQNTCIIIYGFDIIFKCGWKLIVHILFVQKGFYTRICWLMIETTAMATKNIYLFS